MPEIEESEMKRGSISFFPDMVEWLGKHDIKSCELCLFNEECVTKKVDERVLGCDKPCMNTLDIEDKRARMKKWRGFKKGFEEKGWNDKWEVW